MILCHGSYVCYRGVGRRRAGRKSILFGENGHLTRELPMDHGSGVYGSGVPQPEEEEEEEEGLTDIPPKDDLSIPGGAWLDVCFCLYKTDI